MQKHDLIDFIKFGLRSKWKHLTEEELDAVISEYVFVEEIHVGDEHLPAIRHAITKEEIEKGKAESLVEWGEKNLQDTDFWGKVATTVRGFKPRTGIGILVLILHFGNEEDATLFTLCWK